MKHLYGRSERDHEKIIAFWQLACEAAHAALHVWQDVDHTTAGVHQNSNTGIDLIFFENLDILQVIVFVQAKIILRQTRDEVILLVFYGCENADEVNVDFQGLLRTHMNHKGTKAQRHQGSPQETLLDAGFLGVFVPLCCPYQPPSKTSRYRR